MDSRSKRLDTKEIQKETSIILESKRNPPIDLSPEEKALKEFQQTGKEAESKLENITSSTNQFKKRDSTTSTWSIRKFFDFSSKQKKNPSTDTTSPTNSGNTPIQPINKVTTPIKHYNVTTSEETLHPHLPTIESPAAASQIIELDFDSIDWDWPYYTKRDQQNRMQFMAGGSFLLAALGILAKSQYGNLFLAAMTIGGVAAHLLSKQSVFKQNPAPHGKKTERNVEVRNPSKRM